LLLDGRKNGQRLSHCVIFGVKLILVIANAGTLTERLKALKYNNGDNNEQCFQ
jgi:hypothetical protein